MAADLRIRMHIRFPGDPPADLSGFSDPVTIQGVVVRYGNRAVATQEQLANAAPQSPKETAHD